MIIGWYADKYKAMIFRPATMNKEGCRTWEKNGDKYCLLYTSPSPRDGLLSRMPSSA